MTFVRHRDRHIKASFVSAIEGALADLGWFAEGGLLGLGAVRVVQEPLDEAQLKPVVENTVFVDFGTQVSFRDVQLGSGVLSQKYPVFVDVLSGSSSTSGMIAEDLRDRLQGLVAGSRFLPMVNQATGLPLSGFTCEVVEVFKEMPDPKKSFWVSLKVGIVVHFPGDDS